MVDANARSLCLVVMARAPVPGRVKARLAASVGPVRATAIYRQLLRNTLKRLSTVGAHRVLSCEPHTGHADFRQLAGRYGWHRIPQPGDGLGDRMSRLISKYQQHFEHVIITGSDLANIDADFISECHQRLLDGRDLVLGAAADGGYGLIGMQRLSSGIFRDMPWGTGRVLQLTLHRARQACLEAAVVEGLQDVDTYPDYRQSRSLIQENACVV